MTEPAAGDDPFGQALRLQREAAGLGFDWNHADELWAKLEEEIGELREATAQSPARVLDEFGDLLFVVFNLSRHLQVDPAQALALANDKFRRRFGHVLRHRDRWDTLSAPTRIEEMEKLWVEAKRLGL